MGGWTRLRRSSRHRWDNCLPADAGVRPGHRPQRRTMRTYSSSEPARTDKSRGGNGRTVRLFLEDLAEDAGLTLEWTRSSHDRNNVRPARQHPKRAQRLRAAVELSVRSTAATGEPADVDTVDAGIGDEGALARVPVSAVPWDWARHAIPSSATNASAAATAPRRPNSRENISAPRQPGPGRQRTATPAIAETPPGPVPARTAHRGAARPTGAGQ